MADGVADLNDIDTLVPLAVVAKLLWSYSGRTIWTEDPRFLIPHRHTSTLPGDHHLR